MIRRENSPTKMILASIQKKANLLVGFDPKYILDHIEENLELEPFGPDKTEEEKLAFIQSSTEIYIDNFSDRFIPLQGKSPDEVFANDALNQQWHELAGEIADFVIQEAE